MKLNTDSRHRYIYVKRLYSLHDREADNMQREVHMRKRKNTSDVVMMR